MGSYLDIRLFEIAKRSKNRENVASSEIEPFPTAMDKILLILEEVLITFFITLIPELIALGRPPQSITEIWISLLTSLLRAIYCYMRIRNIEKAKAE